MRVAMIDPSLFTLPYDGALAGGLAEAGHEVTLFGRRAGPDDSNPSDIPLAETFYRVAGSRSVAALPGALRLGVKGLDHLWSMARLLRRLQRERPEVIHFQWLPLPLVDRPMLSRFHAVAPLVLTVHDTNPFNGDPTSRLQTRGFLDCLGRFNRLIVHTEQGRARLANQGVDPARLVVLPHGPLGADPGPQQADPMQGELTLMLFGKIKPYKGADVLIQAFAQLPDSLRGRARLRIVGKPYMDLEPLHALVQKHGLGERVRIEPRFVADAEIPTLFAPGTIAVFPYREIDSSGVLPMALAHARPVVASRIGVFAELLQDGVHGHLVAPDDVGGLAAALSHCLADRDFAAACSSNALALSAGGADWASIAHSTAAVYRDAIALADAREPGVAAG